MPNPFHGKSEGMVCTALMRRGQERLKFSQTAYFVFASVRARHVHEGV